MSAALIAAACTTPAPSVEPVSVPPTASVEASPAVGSSWVELPLQPRGGPGDLWVQGAFRGPQGVAVTGQLAGPLAEESYGVRPVAWYLPNGSTWRPAVVEAFSDGTQFGAERFGSIFESDDLLLAFLTGSRNGIDLATTVMQSEDGGQSWHPANVDVSLDTVVTDVARGGPGFVAVGYTSDPIRRRATVLVSENGIDWASGGLRTETGRPFGAFNAVAAKGEFLVAVGSTRDELDAPGMGQVWTSPDGLIWTAQPLPADENAEMRDVVAYGDGFVVVGSVAGASAAWWSPDGAAWTRAELPAIGGARYVASIAAMENGLVAVGDATDHAVAWHSFDGQRWEPAGLLTSEAASARFVLAVESGALVLGNSSNPAEPLAWVSPPSLARGPEPAATLPFDASPAAVVGETPGPDATPWPNGAWLPGVTLADLARLAGTLGMTCESGSGTIPASSRLQWFLQCEASVRKSNFRLEAHYLNPDLFSVVSISASPIETRGPPGDAAWIEAAVTSVVNLPYGGNQYPNDPVGWIRANLYRAECFGTFSCLYDDGTVQIVLQLGYPGYVTVYLNPSPQQYR